MDGPADALEEGAPITACFANFVPHARCAYKPTFRGKTRLIAMHGSGVGCSGGSATLLANLRCRDTMEISRLMNLCGVKHKT